MVDYEIPNDYIKNKLDYKVINRGKCMLCGKELTEGFFFCKDWISGKCICPKCYDRHKNTAIQLADIYQEGDSNGTV